ncbi:MAG: hypothetical protein H0W50_03985 [Parachlamydiaceae bacterium]|nr:hypothetical protein [Parachlamydiaceae bacterium]
MTFFDTTAAFITNSFNRAIEAVPKTLVMAAVGAGLALLGTALKINLFVFNPVAAALFCAASYFLKKTLVEPITEKIIDPTRANEEFKILAPSLAAIAIANIAIGVFSPATAVCFARGAVTYAASALALSGW